MGGVIADGTYALTGYHQYGGACASVQPLEATLVVHGSQAEFASNVEGSGSVTTASLVMTTSGSSLSVSSRCGEALGSGSYDATPNTLILLMTAQQLVLVFTVPPS
jgi:hypothetical protein